MSSDIIFAAQFWLWPDPAMKRDMQGRILFINAAFLQLYGGSVEAWTGQVLEGWPAPQMPQPGAHPPSYRFETRVPSQGPTHSEQVFDWMEQSLPDGGAFAIARNVTDLLQNHAANMAPQESYNNYEAEQVDASQALQAHQANLANDIANAIHRDAMSAFEEPAPEQNVQAQYSEPAPQYEMPPQQAPVQNAPTYEAPAHQHPQQNQPHQSQPQQNQPQQNQPMAEPQPQYEVPAQAAQNVAPQPDQAVPAQMQQAAPQQMEVQRDARDFERRALPLEANSTILGNNWRDAVIAKAVGAGPQAETQPAAPAPAPAEEEQSTSSKHILLAEDNAINALLTRTLLEAEGHTVETVEDGALAVEAMKTQSFDLIFMDMRMPNMDGLESTRKIRQLPNVPRTLPIIALTANAFDDDRNACFDSGMNDFMTKPVSAEELTEMVVTWTNPEKMKMAS